MNLYQYFPYLLAYLGEIRHRIESNTLFKGVKVTLSVFSAFSSDVNTICAGDVHNSVVSDCEFPENQCSGSRTLIRGVNEVLFVIYTHATRFG
jgi:hypothetical protein